TPSQYRITLTGCATYSLHVITTSGEEVSGTTTIPLAGLNSTTLTPTSVFDRLRDTLRLSWRRVQGARSYELLLRSFGMYRTFTDTSVALPGTALTIQGDMVFPTGPMSVFVTAVDENYYDYYRAQSDPFAGAAPSHLIGAIGVFGSSVPILSTQLDRKSTRL